MLILCSYNVARNVICRSIRAHLCAAPRRVPGRSIDCSGLLSCDYSKTLWVYFANGHIEAGWGADVRHNRLIEYIDTDPYVIKSVAFGTGDGVTGDFHFTSLRGNNNDVLHVASDTNQFVVRNASHWTQEVISAVVSR